jgi:dTDP-4-amino-4,6-dideoxygalactose transaminase
MATLTLTPWRDRYLVFGMPDIRREDYEEIIACLDSRWIGTGPRVTRLEETFRTYIGAPTAVAVNSGSAALQLALKGIGLEPGSEIITTTMTFCATANAIVHAGCVPVLVDCERETMNLDVAAAARHITKRTRAILPVHFAGRPCDMGALMDLARAHKLAVIEDCAHAIEATIDGQHCGTFGDFGCFSFYVTKNVTTVEGGVVVCGDAALADRIAVLALHGMTKDARYRYRDDGYVHYDVHEPGFKHNLTDLAAALGLGQLARVEANWERRRVLWEYYLAALRDLPLILPAPVPPNARHALHLFTCLVDDRATRVTRDKVLQGLHHLRIGGGVHYRAVHQLDYYCRTLPATRQFPNADYISERTFSIPLSPAVTDDDAADVVKALHMVLA